MELDVYAARKSS